MKTTVIKTALGWEPAYWSAELDQYIIEPGFALPTKNAAIEALRQCDEECRQLDTDAARERAKYDYACGYRE